MAPRARSGVASVLLLLVLGSRASAQTLQIGIIDFYGLGRLSVPTFVRRCLKEGDSISFAGNARPAFLVEAERRLTALPGVIRASVNPVCCDAGRVIVYVGLEQQDQPVTRFRDSPTGTGPPAAGRSSGGARLGRSAKGGRRARRRREDDSRGHTLMHDAAARAIQDRLVGYAARDMKALKRVLRECVRCQPASYRRGSPWVCTRQAGCGAGSRVRMQRLAGCPQQRHARALRVHVMVPSRSQSPVQIPHDPFIALLRLAGVDRPEQVVIRPPRSVGGARPEAARGASTRAADVARRDGAMEE